MAANVAQSCSQEHRAPALTQHKALG
jgi:hypothetical protein